MRAISIGGLMRISVCLLGAVVMVPATVIVARSADLVAPALAGPAIAAPDVASGWYLRGGIGYVDYVPGKEDTSHKVAGSALVGLKTREAFSIGAGVGYRFNEFLRFDVTADYRSRSKFVDRSSRTNFAQGFNEETGKFGTSSALANAYFDLGTWHGLTPYVGVGVGVANQGFQRFFSETTCTTVACGDPAVVHAIGRQGDYIFRPNRTGTTLAWALMAGVSADLGRGLSLDASYRYLNAGKAQSGVDAFGFDTRLKSVKSQEARIGLRWAISSLPLMPY